MSVSKRVRFEVFKRDAFTCQYCGRTPPTVVLECDHVTPSAKGGSDEEVNLVTSCFDCNRGKSDVPLDVVTPTIADRLEKQRELTEQLDAYNAFMLEKKHREDGEIDEIGFVWFNHFKRKKNQFTFGPSRVPSIRTFLRKLSKAEILEAIEIAHERVPTYSTKAGDDNKTFRYFCGVCWNKVREREGEDG